MHREDTEIGPPMRNMLYIAAKAPRAGVAKTRLGAGLGHDQAIALYRAFLCDLATGFTLTDAPFVVGWYITPEDAWDDLAPLVSANGPAARVLVQGGGTWTERQQMLFRGAAARGEERVILVASDSPQLRAAVVAEAFDHLDTHDVVLGPTSDGGYYLIGMRGWHDILGSIPMSTNTVFDDILARATAMNVSLGLVETLFDIDEAADLDQLRRLVNERQDLVATRAVLAAIKDVDQASRPTVIAPESSKG